MLAIALLAGIGFTMSLFSGKLAFGRFAGAQVRLGVLSGSPLSASPAPAVLAPSPRPP
jgi:Na+:H+ antiporter, NhaA family